jgi:hypothetical protein
VENDRYVEYDEVVKPYATHDHTITASAQCIVPATSCENMTESLLPPWPIGGLREVLPYGVPVAATTVVDGATTELQQLQQLQQQPQPQQQLQLQQQPQLQQQSLQRRGAAVHDNSMHKITPRKPITHMQLTHNTSSSSSGQLVKSLSPTYETSTPHKPTASLKFKDDTSSSSSSGQLVKSFPSIPHETFTNVDHDGGKKAATTSWRNWVVAAVVWPLGHKHASRNNSNTNTNSGGNSGGNFNNSNNNTNSGRNMDTNSGGNTPLLSRHGATHDSSTPTPHRCDNNSNPTTQTNVGTSHGHHHSPSSSTPTPHRRDNSSNHTTQYHVGASHGHHDGTSSSTPTPPCRVNDSNPTMRRLCSDMHIEYSNNNHSQSLSLSLNRCDGVLGMRRLCSDMHTDCSNTYEDSNTCTRTSFSSDMWEIAQVNSPSCKLEGCDTDKANIIVFENDAQKKHVVAVHDASVAAVHTHMYNNASGAFRPGKSSVSDDLVIVTRIQDKNVSDDDDDVITQTDRQKSTLYVNDDLAIATQILDKNVPDDDNIIRKKSSLYMNTYVRRRACCCWSDGAVVFLLINVLLLCGFLIVGSAGMYWLATTVKSYKFLELTMDDRCVCMYVCIYGYV